MTSVRPDRRASGAAAFESLPRRAQPDIDRDRAKAVGARAGDVELGITDDHDAVRRKMEAGSMRGTVAGDAMRAISLRSGWSEENPPSTK
jgi:hypothetical protein